jgi:iron complex transport system permease protein
VSAVAPRAGETEAVHVPSPPRALWPVVGAVVFTSAAALIGLLVGPVGIGAGSILGSALSHVPLLDLHSHLSATDSAIVWQLRAPRVVLGLLVGGMLGLAGGAYQGVFRNPLVDPYLLGVAAGAGLGATIAIAYANGSTASYDLLPIAAFIGAAAAVALAYVLGATASGGRNPAALVLAGVTVVAFLTAIQTFIQQQHAQTLQEIYSWILGSVDTAGWHDVLLALPYVAVASVVILLHRRLLDVLAVGDEEAAALGVNVRRVRLTIVVFATIGTAAVVAVSGLIGFVGIIVAHFVRLAIGTSYRIVLPLSLLLGAGFLVLCDVIARTVVSPAELPIGVVTAFFGAPFFAIVLRTSRSFR